jgi:mRNA interferase YafQ
MRAIKYTRRFKRDCRREKSGVLGKKLDTLLMEAVNLLAADKPLPQRYGDHPLAGEWSDHRDCHIRPDLVLIYRKPDAKQYRACASRLSQRTKPLIRAGASLGVLADPASHFYAQPAGRPAAAVISGTLA